MNALCQRRRCASAVRRVCGRNAARFLAAAKILFRRFASRHAGVFCSIQLVCQREVNPQPKPPCRRTAAMVRRSCVRVGVVPTT
jgi:hypothetical protein